jgi:2-oxoglutarate ferredoxin oxidoreductase subunit delta
MAKGRIEINEDSCKGCTLWPDRLPQLVIEMVTEYQRQGILPGKAGRSDGKCTGCAICAVACPDVVLPCTARFRCGGLGGARSMTVGC